MMLMTAKISLILFLKNSGFEGSPIMLMKPDRMDAVSGVAARNKTIIQIRPQEAF